MATPPTLDWIQEQLLSALGAPPRPVPRAPFEWVLWENAAHPLQGDRRERAYRALEQQIGLRPDDIARAEAAMLRRVAALGGMGTEQRCANLRRCAEVALELGGGDLRALLELPAPRARRELARFPGLGDAGVDKVLLFCFGEAQPAFDLDGQRVLLRLGHGHADTSSAGTYRAVQHALPRHASPGADAFQQIYGLLQLLGRDHCTQAAPRCGPCALHTHCAHALANAPATAAAEPAPKRARASKRSSSGSTRAR